MQVPRRKLQEGKYHSYNSVHWIGCLILQLIAPHVYVQKKLEKVEVARMVEIDKDVKEEHVTGRNPLIQY